MRLQSLVDRSLADVRLEAGVKNVERVPVWEIIEEVEITGSMFAQGRRVQLVVRSLDHTVQVTVDRQILASALVNLLQNAFKFTHANSVVSLRVAAAGNRVTFDVEDECGGLPPGTAESLMRPFAQRGSDRSGLGLGLTICVKAVQACGGELRVTNLPGKGCIFTIDLAQLIPGPQPAA